MEYITELFQYEYNIRALIASSMVGITCGILGCFIVLRNMSLIGDALSHAILPGVVGGFLVVGYSVLGFFTGSVIAGLLTALMITWIQRNVKTQEDAAIGIVFTSMFAIGVMGISWLSQKEGVHLDLTDFLMGKILGISNNDLIMTGLVMCFNLLCVIAFYRYFFITTFDSVIAQTLGISVSTVHYFLMLLLSFTIVASLQSVGVILVVAMLITPASTAYLLTFRMDRMLVIAAAVGLLSAVCGLIFALAFDTTPGPAMTVTATFFYLLAVFFSPKRGLVRTYLKRRKMRKQILREDVLKQALKLQEYQQANPAMIAKNLELEPSQVVQLLKHLERNGYLSFSGNEIELSSSGVLRGNQLIRAHRLWETYQVEMMGLHPDQIHLEAEKYEHILTEALVEELAKELGYPDQDPHGSPIPKLKDPES